MLRYLLALSCLLLGACSHDSAPRASAEVQHEGENAQGWPTYGGQLSGTHYSSLDQINVKTVKNLEVTWTYHVGEMAKDAAPGDRTAYEVTPIYANDTLYLCSPFNHVVALDPSTGHERWRFDPKRPRSASFYNRSDCRGVAYWEGDSGGKTPGLCAKRIFETTLNGVLLAVDADTGAPCVDFGTNGRVDLNGFDKKGHGDVYSTSPPSIYQDIVITGSSVYDNVEMDAPDGIVRAFDVRTGAQVWSWNPIPEHLSIQTGGANTWAPMSIDPQRGWVFLPTTSPSIDKLGILRNEPIPYANAVVVLDARTGELIWSYQVVRHDLWDYDLPSIPALVDVQRDGKSVPAVLQPTKMGLLFLLDRATGQPLFPVTERAAPQSDVPGEHASVTQPVPQLPASVVPTQVTADDAWGMAFFDKQSCRRKFEELRNEGLYTPPSLRGSILYPSFIGGTNWGGAAYDEASGLAVLNATNIATFLRLIPRNEYDAEAHQDDGHQHSDPVGSSYIIERGMISSPLGIGPFKLPCNPPPWGTLTAVDLNTGATRWQVPFGRLNVLGPIKSPAGWGAPSMGGPIITRGGLIFIGASPDNLLRAYDLHSGEQVWAGDLPAPATATPMTFQGRDGRQFVVVAAGGRDDFHTDLSDAIVAFALKKQP